MRFLILADGQVPIPKHFPTILFSRLMMNPDVIIAACACSGCMVQIQGGLDKQLPVVRMRHVADILAERIKG